MLLFKAMQMILTTFGRPARLQKCFLCSPPYDCFHTGKPNADQQQAAPSPLYAATYHFLSIITTHTFPYTVLQTNALLLSVVQHT